MVTRCASSHMMTALLTWRNPHGDEERWISENVSIPNKGIHAAKVIAAEVGLSLVLLIAMVETAVYFTFVLISLMVYPLTDRPLSFSVKLIQSSSFTSKWALADLLIFNLFLKNVFTHESFARSWGLTVRPEDQEYLMGLPYMANLFQDDGGIFDPHVEGRVPDAPENAWQQQGVDLLKKLYNEADETTQAAFKDVDVDILHLMMTKAIHYYVFVDTATQEFAFFKPDTRKLIQDLRRAQYAPEVVTEIDRLLKNREAFESELQVEEAQELFKKLQARGSEETQGSALVTTCWGIASKQLFPSEDEE